MICLLEIERNEEVIFINLVWDLIECMVGNSIEWDWNL